MAIHSFRSFLRRFARPFLRPIFRVLFRVRVEGEIPPVWPERLLVVANHESFLDGPLLGLFLPLDPVYVIHTDIAPPGISAFCCPWWITWWWTRPIPWP